MPSKTEANKLIFQQIPSPWLLPEKDVDCGKNWTVDEDHVGPRIENIEHLNKTVENMVQLDEVHPATVLHANLHEINGLKSWNAVLQAQKCEEASHAL